MLGNLLQTSSLLTDLNLEPQPTLEMLVFGLNLAGKFKFKVFLVELITSCHCGKLACTHQPKAFQAKNGLRVGTGAKVIPPYAASYSTAVI